MPNTRSNISTLLCRESVQWRAQKKEVRRDFYADKDVWNAVYSVACEELKDAMDLNYLSGQRPADVLKMRETA